ncbi:DUF3842 family protein [Treponema sp.]|uniref:DUF3842 family protein n=1 Tax=Treponema sp. TaxID=166 RepID=UPI003FA1ED2F
MHILVIDGQGGGIGKQLVEEIRKALPEAFITAAGTNSIATSAMIKAGADNGATGENAVIVGCRNADIIAGPMGIVIADSLLGEITPSMAVAVGQSSALRILLPVNRCKNLIIGIADMDIATMIKKAVEEIKKAAQNE